MLTRLNLDKMQLAKLVSNAGSIPVQRNTTYTSFEEYTAPELPSMRRLRMATGD